MSGKKRILVDEQEWYKLQRQASHLKEIKRDLPKLIEDVRQRSEADLQRVFRQVEQRQEAAAQTMSQLSEQTRRMESKTNEELKRQEQSLRDELRSSAGDLRWETLDQLAQQESRWRKELDAERRQRREEARQLSGRVADLEQDRASADAAARTWLSDASAMHELIRSSLPHQRFAPGELDRLDKRYQSAAEDQVQGHAEAALATAQSVFYDLSDLRLRLELADREWRRARVAAVEGLTRIEGLIDQNNVLPARDERGLEVEGTSLDVDYWSGGGLSRLSDDVRSRLIRVQDEEQPMTTADLEDAARQVGQLEQQLIDLVEQAGLRQLSSQVRVNLVDAVVQTLDEAAGYEFVDGTYAGEDQRQGFFAKVEHQNGNSIVVDVSPVDEDSGRCMLRLLSYDGDTASSAARHSRAQALTAALRARGLQVHEPEEEPGEPDPGFQDLETVRRQVPRSAVGS